ncbi:MAG: ABC-F family ATP-binding cassette domain-containing protein [Anaerolineae bacterium]
MLVINQLTKRFGDDLLFENVSFVVNRGERIGLVGPNGCGKTTLLRIITGQESPSAGVVSVSPPDLRIGYLPQGLEPPPDATVGDVLYPAARRIAALEAALERLGGALADAPDDPAVLAAYDSTLAELSRLATLVAPETSGAVLAGLGLADLALETPAAILSGGQKTRLGLARLLLGGAQLLLLDEPTNHLDITALEWLEGWLSAFDGAALIVSHDRAFLDRSVNRIVALDPLTRTARVFPGNYTAYVEAVVREREKLQSEWRDQVDEIERLTRDVRQTMAKAQRYERASETDQQRRYAKKIARKAKAKEKRLKRYMESDERVEKPRLSWQMKLDLADVEAGSRDALRLVELSVGYDRKRPLLTDLTLTLRAGERVALIGPNGCGKTTLLRTIMGEIPPLTGKVYTGASTKVGYLAQEQDTLTGYAHALEAIQSVASLTETATRSFLHYFLFSGDDVFTPMADLSYGERARLMLAQLVAQGCNLLILDEPINHLDVPSRERFEQAMANFEGTVLAVVHDRYFVNRFASQLWVAEQGTVRVYVDLEAYQKVRQDAHS